jgi:thioredoxin-like negative regulator of GroEL
MGGGQQQAGHPAGPIRVVLYYLPKCPHCIAMLPEWQKFASLHEHDADLKVHAVNAEADPAAAARANVQAFPTVVLYRYNGQKLFFNGDRTAAALERWVNHHQIERQE